MAGIQVEVITVSGQDGSKYQTMGRLISEFFKTHPDYKYVDNSFTEMQNCQGNITTFIYYEVS